MQNQVEFVRHGLSPFQAVAQPDKLGALSDNLDLLLLT
ncbi:protein of unknown function [Kyrpidia spormannii]|uniref:Uncharacterized protein n=1 Tax=Kyrpidia spormannii TaxID=2055160 RepID=A0ACA8ZDX4_9BACL|nr:protein of unknown function [Kyrpidia spormannii]